MIVYALDIGGSSVKHALIDTEQDPGHFVRSYQSLQLKSRKFEDLKNQILASVRDVLAANTSVDTVAVSTTGGVDENGTVINAGHFEGYSNVSWEKILREQISQLQRVITMNDGKAATWAEYIGEIQNVNSFVHFVVGTGIGGASVIDKRIITGDGGYAGYLGHIKVTNEDTATCSCGKMGCVETVASALAIIRYFEKHRGSEVSSSRITLDDVVSAALAGDEIAEKAFEIAGAWLGIAMSNVMNILNPGIITVGGGVVLAADKIRVRGKENPFLKAASESARTHAHRRVVATTEIRQARYGNDGGIIGAAMMAHTTIP